MNPDDKSHPKFKDVADLQPLLYSRCELVWKLCGGHVGLGCLHFGTKMEGAGRRCCERGFTLATLTSLFAIAQ